MTLQRLALALLLVFAAVACEDDDGTNTTEDATTAQDTSTAGDTTAGDTTTTEDTATGDTATTEDSATGDTTTGDTTAEDTTTTEDTATGPTGTLFGTVVRSASPSDDGVGNVYVGVFESDPVLSPTNPPTPVANLLIENADLSANDASVAYEIPDIPLRAEPYFVSAFFDDNGNADPGNDPGPDRGDLVTTEGIAGSPSTVINAERVEFTIDLNFSLPF